MKNTKNEIVAVIDTREKKPLDLEKYGLSSTVGTLVHGDYSLLVPDLRKIVTVERKSLPDFVACCGRDRARFEKEMLAIRGYKHKLIICEFTLNEVFEAKYRSKIKPQSVLGSIARWNTYGIQFLFAENPTQASWLVAKYLELIARDTLQLAKIACGIIL